MNMWSGCWNNTVTVLLSLIVFITVEENVNPTLIPEPCPPSTTPPTDLEPEPTADSELNQSDQECELTLTSVPKCVLVECEGIEWSLTHTPKADRSE